MENNLVIPKEMIKSVENYSTEEVAEFMRAVTDAMCNLFESKDKATRHLVSPLESGKKDGSSECSI
jgi:diadenosine tetraphosphate (Ap4A) HIT family hydrolase